jgi:nitroreductase
MDAARWSPSCFNAQPWRFYTSTDNTFDDFLNLLVEGNQGWAKDNAVIGFLVGEKNFEHNGKPNEWSAFDSGAAWMSMTLQARMEGLYTHGMGGIKAAEAADYLGIDTDTADVLMGFTIGKLADLSQLDEEQRENETPNSRKGLSEIWHSV